MKPAAVAVLLFASVAGCGGPRPQSKPPETPAPPSPPPAPSPGDITVNGSERLGWDQDVSGSDVRTFAFVAYVDGARAMLGHATCSGGTSGPASCSAALPPMSPGRHVLELAAVRVLSAGYVEGERSASFTVTMLAAGSSSADAGGAAQSIGAAAPRSDSDMPAIDVVTRDAREVTDLAAAPNGDVFLAERRGTIRILRAGGLLPEPAFTLGDAVRDTGNLALLSVALSPDFDDSRRVYALYAAPSPKGIDYHVITGREVGGRIGEIATIFNAGPSTAPLAGLLRVARDGTLNVAVSDRIHRLNADGTARRRTGAADAPVTVLSGVSGLDVSGEDGDLYALAAPRSGRVLTRLRGESDAIVYAWPPQEQPLTVARYSASAIPAFAGRMLFGTAAATLQAIDLQAPQSAPFEIALGDSGRVTAIAVDANGSVFVAAREHAGSEPSRLARESTTRDVIFRLHPQQAVR